MATPRRGAESSETRTLLLDMTERVMLDDGYAAVSSRRIAKEAGVSPALVHFYFATLDDLFLATFRRRAEQQLERHERILKTPQPLHALWGLLSDPAGAAMLMEFMALANHRKSMASEIATYAERFRQIELEALADRFDEYGLDAVDLPPVVLLVLVASLSRTIVQEQAIGMTTGIAETLELVDRYLERLEGPPPEGTRRRPIRARGARPRR